MACITVCLAKHVNKSPLNSSRNVRCETRQIATDICFVHQILQIPFLPWAKVATIVVLWNSMPQMNLSALKARWAWVRKQTNVEIKEPGKDEVIPSLKIASGEKPLVETVEYAKDAPQNFTDCWVNAIMPANWFHLEKRQCVGKEHS